MQDVLNGLTEKELADIRELRAFATDRDKHSIIPSRDWLQPWRTSKNEYLRCIFQDDLILERPVVYSQDQIELSHMIEDLVFNGHFRQGATDEQINAINWATHMEEFYQYLKTSIENRVRNALVDIYALMDSWYLASNTFFKENQDGPTLVPYGNGKYFKIQPNCKVSKALGKLSQIAGLQDEWEPVRIKISQILNQSKLNGTLHLSIHPIDYLTASVNNYDWSSCMELCSGDYRRGIIEMMNSSMVVVGYLTGSNKTFNLVSDICPNNKKWREFFIVTPEMISGIKGYPYWNSELEIQVINWIRELIAAHQDELPKQFQDVTWIDGVQQFRMSEKNTIKGLDHEVKFDMQCGPAMYDDFYSGETYQAIFSNKMPSFYSVDYSGFSECLACGNDCSDGSAEPHDMLCDSCNDFVYCSLCGDRYNESELIEFNGNLLCGCCYEALPICEHCAEKLDEGEEFCFYVKRQYADGQEKLYDRLFTLCRDCWEDCIIDKNQIIDIEPPWFHVDKYITVVDFTNLIKDCQERWFYCRENENVDEKYFNGYRCWDLTKDTPPKVQLPSDNVLF